MRAARPECELVMGWERSPEWKLVRMTGMTCMGTGAGMGESFMQGWCTWYVQNSMLITWGKKWERMSRIGKNVM